MRDFARSQALATEQIGTPWFHWLWRTYLERKPAPKADDPFAMDRWTKR